MQDNTHLSAAGVLRQTARAIVSTVNSAAPSPVGHTMRSNSDFNMRLRYVAMTFAKTHQLNVCT